MSHTANPDSPRLSLVVPGKGPSVEKFCSKCCEDMDIKVQDLYFPDLYMDAAGQEFVRVHGLDLLRRTNGRIRFKLGDLVFDIGYMELLFPHRYLKGADLAWYYEHELDQVVQKNATIKLLHRCDQLAPNGRCTIYENRPKICRDFDCRTRVAIDCENLELIQLAAKH